MGSLSQGPGQCGSGSSWAGARKEVTSLRGGKQSLAPLYSVGQEKGCPRVQGGLQRADWRASSSGGRRRIVSPGAAAASFRVRVC